jgi:hypothetical protein
MSATAGLMAGTQIFRDDESPILYVFAGKYREFLSFLSTDIHGVHPKVTQEAC